MAKTTEKRRGEGMFTTPFLDQIQVLRELNCAFLGLLQARAQSERPCFGLPPGLRPLLTLASPDLLEAIADFPRALFKLCAEPRERGGGDAASGRRSFDEVEYHLASSILHALRQTSRQSPYQARVLFGLELAEVQRFGALTLDDLRRLAGTPGLLQCALTDRQWFWQGLLTANRPESRRQLALLALQPVAAAGWPQRRPAHSVR